MDGKLKLFRYLAYAIEITVLHIVAGIPGFMPSIFGTKPMILLAVALTVAVFEGEIPAMIVGLICGALCDIGTTNGIGYYTVALTILCFVIGYCARNFFVTSFLNAMVIGVVSVALLMIFNFLFFETGREGIDLLGHFLRHFLVGIVYTVLFLPPLFWFNRLFCGSVKTD